MQRVLISGAFVALATRAMAGVAAPAEEEANLDFVDQKWEPVKEGAVWPIKWSAGNGNPLTLSIKNATWEHVICDEEAAPGSQDWTVDVPECGCEYQMKINQDECDELESASFVVECAEEAAATTAAPEASHAPHGHPHGGKWAGQDHMHAVTVVWEDEDCSCQKTTETSKSWPASKTDAWTWYDEDLKCSVTAQPPAPTATDDDCDSDDCDEASSAPVAPASAKAEPTEAPKKPVAGAEGDDKPVAGAEGDDKPVAGAEGDDKPVAGAASAAATSAAAMPTEANNKPVAGAEGDNKPVAGAEGDNKPAAAISGGNKPVAPTESKPAAYTGAGAKMTASLLGLSAVMVAAMAL